MSSQDVSSSIARFAVKFCNELEKGRSVVSSPLSAEYVLALLALGANEPSRSELLTALGFPDNDTIRSAFSSVSSKLRSVKGVTLNVANRIYVREGSHKLQPNLVKGLRSTEPLERMSQFIGEVFNAARAPNWWWKDATNVFDADIMKEDFSQSTAAAESINKWVESKTNYKIKDLISPGFFNDDTCLVIVNALYFKGSWKIPFHPNNTTSRDFDVNKTTKIQVPMMYNNDSYTYGENDVLKAQLLEMYYKGKETSMVIILPREIEGLNMVLKELADGFDLMNALNEMYITEVKVSVPQFKIETDIDLNGLLPKLGIQSIFDEKKSGLSNILDPPKELYVSKAIQKAFIEVNEEGTEAAAATGSVMERICGRWPPIPYFTCDRPFLYILFGPQRSTLFIGVYCGK